MPIQAKGQRVTFAALAACVLAFVLLPGCTAPAGSAGKVTAWNPLTWFSGSAGRDAARADARADEATAKVVKAAQQTAHETKQALAVAPDSRPVEVAREANNQTVTLLDQAAGPLTIEEAARVRDQVTKLVSDNAKLREEGEKMRADSRETINGLSEKLAKADAALAASTKDLQAAFARENDLANKLRNERFVLVATAILAAIGYLGVLYLRFAYGGIPEAIGRGLSQLRAANPQAATLATGIFDSYLNRHEQTRISRHT